MTVRLTVVGSVNLDLVASGSALPCPGQTVTGAVLARHPGGKGANQALAARRLGAEVRLVARVGADPFAAEALALLRADGVDMEFKNLGQDGNLHKKSPEPISLSDVQESAAIRVPETTRFRSKGYPR